MTIIFAIGTIALLSLMYWGAYQNGKEIKTIEIRGNLLLQFPEFIFKLLLLGLCLGIAQSLEVARPEKYFGWPPTNIPVDITIGAVIGLVCQFGANLLAALAIRFWGAGIYSPAIMKSIVPKTWLQWILILPPLLLAVVVEEVLFRALAIGGFSVLPIPWIPWILAVGSSLLFGIVHVPQGSLGMILAGAIGFIFAAIFIITGSLLIVISAHFILNFLQILRAKEDENWLNRFTRPDPPTESQSSQG